MTDPYAELGVSPESDDETIRKRYLELVREFSPEQHPQRFSAIRAAYEAVRDLNSRVHYRLFEQGRRDSIEHIIEEIACRTTRRRYSLQSLLDNLLSGTLTPEKIERVLADFRGWLENLPSVDGSPAPTTEPVDLHSLVSQFVALRHEVNLQTKASRSTLEQNAEALRQLEEAVAALRETPEEAGPDPDESLKPLLKAVIDVYDALALAVRQVERQKEKIYAGLETILEAAVIEPPPELPAGAPGPKPGFWQRLFGEKDSATNPHALTAWRERVVQQFKEREQRVREANDFLRQALDGLLTGYTMSLNRIDRVLSQFDIETMNCAGHSFDPELMEVVEVISDSGQPAGEVIEEVKRGYIWKDRIFRYAQVRVAK